MRLAQFLVQDESHALFDLRVCRKVVRSTAGPPRHRATAEAAAAMARDATDATHARDVAMAAGSRKRQFGLLKPRAAPCRACSASSRSSGRRAPPSPSPATSSGWLNLEWPRVRCSASSATERCVRPRARAGLSSAPATAGWHLPGRTRLPRAGSSGPSAACTQAYGHGHVTVAR